ncbi:MAG TPA: hypothetical protein VKB35_19200, partial [Ktedonobacteraceae bacterium]|nr:hypothetical protein [Ktedonobacteraceae bacterium]
MLGILTDVIRPPQWFIALCKWIWSKRELFWVAMFLGVAANLCASWLVTPLSSSYRHSPIGWAIEHPIAFFVIGVSILALNVLVYVGTLFDRGSEIQTERKYLRRMEDETRVLRLTGIPADLIAPGVPLDEVFIPLRFHSNRPRTDLPLTEPDFPGEPSVGDSPSHATDAQELQRIYEQFARRSWQRPFQEHVTSSVAELWHRITPEQPAVVIQGFPGMGKSTLLNRLTLHMARRGLIPDRLGRSTDPLVPDPQASILSPILVPLLIRLSEYAAECKQNPNLSLTDYMEKALRRFDIRQLAPVVEKRLAAGRCLIMLDGLDEVSDPQTRSQVQQAIQTFVRNWSRITDNRAAGNFNRFLITSRVAGYDPSAFPDYMHVIIANLTPEQIEDFLPRWCRASVRRDRIMTAGDAGGQEAAIAREADQQARLLSAAIRAQQGVRELAVNPLLL